MASLRTISVYNQSGSIRGTMPKDWIEENGIKSKDKLDAVVSHAIIILPPRELTETEVEEIWRDMKIIMKARGLLSTCRTQGNTKSTLKQ